MSGSPCSTGARHCVAAAALLFLAACTPRLEAPRQFSIFFVSDQSMLTPEAQKMVGEIAADAHRLEPSKIVVAGRADGETAHDATLADQRATTVMQGLVQQGVSAAMIEKQADAPSPERKGVAAHEVIVRFLP